ncbi:MAG: thiamine phosphate synthase [Lachnospiraceae bacterium]|nr:thiamine phosphate synthase [Lachnospiraceae bacterium]
MSPAALRLYAVSDRSRLRAGESLDGLLPALFENGVTCFQLREKGLPEPQLLEEAQRLLPICRSFGIPFILNDNVAIARQIGADGVHVGLSDMGIARTREILGPNAIIGGSAHSVFEALAAEQAGADYLGCGAVFGSTTKADATQLSPEELAAICRAVHIPVVAIGGITGQNLPELAGSGIAGPAVVNALFAQPNPAAAAKRLRALSDALFG